jgi:hypothetical protein
MTEAGMEVEWEMDMIDSGEVLKICSDCGTSTYRTYCPGCADRGKMKQLTGDELMDKLKNTIAEDPDLDLDALINNEWEPI